MTYRILKFLDDGILVQKTPDGEEMLLRKVNIPKNAKIGDILKLCEHNFYDIIDENGNFLSRW